MDAWSLQESNTRSIVLVKSYPLRVQKKSCDTSRPTNIAPHKAGGCTQNCSQFCLTVEDISLECIAHLIYRTRRHHSACTHMHGKNSRLQASQHCSPLNTYSYSLTIATGSPVTPKVSIVTTTTWSRPGPAYICHESMPPSGRLQVALSKASA